jgi:DNA mismatch repair protein MutS
MRQYARFKALHPECVLFFRMGDFYEMFDDDARLAHRVLGLTLTERTAGVPMAGVPYHAVDGYLRRMIAAGHRVAVCEQVQDPAEATGIVDRAVTRVITPGTLVDESLLDAATANHVAAIQFVASGDEAPAVLALAELSTGQFTLVDLPRGRVADELVRHAPSELLYAETADGAAPPRVDALQRATRCALTPRPAWTFRLRDAADELRAHFGVATLEGFGLREDDPALGPAGALLRYLREMTGAVSTDHDAGGTPAPERRGVPHLRPPRRDTTDEYLVIDATSLRSLELERTMRSGGTEGTLLSVFGRCRTPMGRRLLRQWVCFPLRDRVRIIQRQEAVSALRGDRELRCGVMDRLDRVQDVARISARIALDRATPRDVVALGASLRERPGIAALLDGRPPLAVPQESLLRLQSVLDPLAQTILERCVDAPPAHLREGGLFRDGVDAELDEARLLQRDAGAWLAAYQKRLIEETAIGSLKVGFNRVFGYYIEITHTHATRIPPGFARQQTLKNAERYITPELKAFEERVTSAKARAIEREKLLFERLGRQAAAQAEPLAEFADTMAQLDVLCCFAEVAARHGYIRPDLVDDPVLDIRQGRHPVLDGLLRDRFVPNDCTLGEPRLEAPPLAVPERGPAAPAAPDGFAPSPARGSLALITGPNMAGKSTFIRQAALMVLMAHTGSFVPAEAATIGLCDRIFTRIGAADELHAGQSTFMVEMVETANILNHATASSLVILDEIGRGTSTLDGLSLAWAIAETLAQRGCRTLFATHYHELTALAERMPGVANLHVAVREWGPPGGEQIIFLYRILPGRTDRSYGIHVAKIAGLPMPTVARAAQLLETLAVQTESPAAGRAPAPGAQLGLFTEYLDHPAIGELRELKLDQLSPMEAFERLRSIQDMARSTS